MPHSQCQSNGHRANRSIVRARHSRTGFRLLSQVPGYWVSRYWGSGCRVFGYLLLLLLGTSASLSAADPLDWPYWRGPEQNGISRETGLVDNWDPAGGDGSNVLWKRPDCGSRSTPIVMDGRMYFLARSEPETPHEEVGERVVCLNPDTGETLWENKFNVWLSDVPEERVGWSSVVGDPETGNVYALGVCGYFQCIDGKSGKTIWSKSLHEEYGLLSTYGGRTNFPVICEDLVLINGVLINWGDQARPRHQYLAFNKLTGECIWMNGTSPSPKETTYSSPSVTVLNGQKALVFGSGDGGVWALQPRTGLPIWQYQLSMRFVTTSPVVVGDTVFSSQSEENISGTSMGAVAAINGTGQGNITKSGTLWKKEELMVGKSSMLHLDGRLYCFDDSAKAFVLDAKSGDMISSRKLNLGTIMRASPLYADGKIYIGDQNGRWFILKPDEKAGMTIVARGRLDQGEEIHASAIASHGKVYIMTTGCLYCLSDKTKKPGATPLPEAPKEKEASADSKPAHVQVIPAEILLSPGDKQQFKVRVFNANGQLLSEKQEAGPTFTLKGPGTIGKDGNFMAPADATHSATYVSAAVGDLVGRARVRIVPPLPWQFTFDGLTDPPITWVGARYRHVLRDLENTKVMVKITTIPLGTKSRCWFGQSDLHDYTIQADVRGAQVGDQMPDVGLIAQGYTIDLQGVNQKLQVRAWDSAFRIEKNVAFAWKPNTWYTMKFQVATKDGKAELRGKVWPRGEKEPEQWTLTAEDGAPNQTGSPGLYGNATNAEIFLDNIKVQPNT